MSNERRIVTLLTDFGTADYYVGAIKGTLLRLAPSCLPVDISHDLAPGDVRAATFLLAAAAPTFPSGTVHLAVVDPGVGSRRRVLIAESHGHYFVGPDNGILITAIQATDDHVIHSVEQRELFLPGPGSTFHGRDRFAPVAAALLRGVPSSDLGRPIDDPVELAISDPIRSDNMLRGEIVHIDRFGNLITNVPTNWLSDHPFVAKVGKHAVRRVVQYYAMLKSQEVGVVGGSLGTLEVSVRNGSLAALWDIRCGAAFVVEFEKKEH